MTKVVPLKPRQPVQPYSEDLVSEANWLKARLDKFQDRLEWNMPNQEKVLIGMLGGVSVGLNDFMSRKGRIVR